MYGYVSAYTGCLLARPFASILNRAAPLGLCCLPELLPNVCKWASPQWCPQLHTVGQRQRTSRSSLSSVTLDPLSVTRHVHPNTGPRQTTMPLPSPDSHSLQLFSIQTDEPLARLLGVLDRVSRICSDILHRDSHTSILSVALELLLEQSGKGNVRKSKQLVSFFSPHLLNRLSSVVIIWAKLLCRADKDRREGGGRRRRAIQKEWG